MSWTDFQALRDSIPGIEARLTCIASSPGSNFGTFRIQFRSWYIRQTTVQFQWNSNTNSGVDSVVVEPYGLATVPFTGNRDIAVRPLSISPGPILGIKGENLFPRNGNGWSAWKAPNGALPKLLARASCVNGGSQYGHWDLQFESEYSNGPVEFDWNIQFGSGAKNWVAVRIDPHNDDAGRFAR